MSNLTLGFLGAVAGLSVALFGNVVLLPYVLRQQDRRLPAHYRTPVIGWDKQKIAQATRLAYWYLFPVFFGLFGVLVAFNMFGSGK